MPLSIKNDRAERLARELAAAARESLTQAVTVALAERLERLKGRRTAPDLVDRLLAIARRCAAFPDLDGRRPDEILGYDRDGTFG